MTAKKRVCSGVMATWAGCKGLCKFYKSRRRAISVHNCHYSLNRGDSWMRYCYRHNHPFKSELVSLNYGQSSLYVCHWSANLPLECSHHLTFGWCQGNNFSLHHQYHPNDFWLGCNLTPKKISEKNLNCVWTIKTIHNPLNTAVAVAVIVSVAAAAVTFYRDH